MRYSLVKEIKPWPRERPNQRRTYMPKKRIPPTQRIDNEINELRYNLGEAVIPKDVLGKFMNMAMRRIVQEILENEVADFTGREYYKHATPKQGYRNGYEPSTLRTA